eukprot:Pgem_evm1s6517
MSLQDISDSQKTLTRKENFVWPKSSHVVKREICDISPESAGVFERSSNRTIKFRVPNSSFLDANDLYFRFILRLVQTSSTDAATNTELLKASNATGSESDVGVKIHNSGCLFSKYKMTINGQILEEIDNFDLVETLCRTYSTNQDIANSPVATSLLMESAEWTDTERTEHRHELLYDLYSPDGVECILKIKSAGFYNLQTNIPLPYMGETHIEFTLNDISRAMQFVEPGTILTKNELDTLSYQISDMQM